MSQQKDKKVLHAELDHPSEVIICATGKVRGLILTDTFKPCEGPLGKAKKSGISKRPVEH